MKDILSNKNKLSHRYKLAMALLALTLATYSCIDPKNAPSLGDCIAAGGHEDLCLEIHDPYALEAKQTMVYDWYLGTRIAGEDAQRNAARSTKQALDMLEKQKTQEAPKYGLAIAESGDTIIDMLDRMGINLNIQGTMSYSQIVGIVVDGKLRFFTLNELIESDPNDSKYAINEGSCLFTGQNEFDIRKGVNDNSDDCPID